MSLTVTDHLYIEGRVDLLFNTSETQVHDVNTMSATTREAYQSKRDLLKDACINRTTNKILRKSYLEIYDPSVFTQDYSNRELTPEEVEKYIKVRKVNIKKSHSGKVIDSMSLTQWMNKNTEEYYKDEPEYKPFNEARKERIQSGEYTIHDIRNSYHPDGGFKELIRKILGFQFKYGPHVSSEKLYLNLEFMQMLKQNFVVDNTVFNNFIHIVRKQDVVENPVQYPPICQNIALVITLNKSLKFRIESKFKNNEQFFRFHKKTFIEELQKYNEPYYPRIHHNINHHNLFPGQNYYSPFITSTQDRMPSLIPLHTIKNQITPNQIPPYRKPYYRTPNPTPPYGTPYYRTQNHTITNQITRTMPPPLIKIGSKYPDNTTNTPHEIKIPKGLEVPADTKPKAPTNYSIDKILTNPQNRDFCR